MEHLLHFLVQRWHLGADHYWHLRLLCAQLLGPVVGVLALLLFAKHTPYPSVRSAPGLWVGRDGQLRARRQAPACRPVPERQVVVGKCPVAAFLAKKFFVQFNDRGCFRTRVLQQPRSFCETPRPPRKQIDPNPADLRPLPLFSVPTIVRPLIEEIYVPLLSAIARLPQTREEYQSAIRRKIQPIYAGTPGIHFRC